MYSLGEPVYALATPFSPSALALIRISGESVIDRLSPYFSSSLDKKESVGVSFGLLKDDGGSKIDEAVAIIYKKGHGYTLEEAIELIIHGSLPSIKRALILLSKIGFREAERGEFTYRAFMNGRIDLTQAEAVEEIVKSKSMRAEMDALERLEGSLKRELNGIKETLIDIIASLEVYLDYGEDEVIDDWVFPEDRVGSIISRLKAMIATYSSSHLYSDGAIVVISGRVNAGKSSLFNAILRENRSIVSEEEGTTRDYIETEILLGDIPVRLFDTAGLREAEGKAESEGIRRSKELIDKANLVIEVIDSEEEREDEKTLCVHSKSDIYGSRGSFSFSSVTGDGLGEILSEVEKRLSSSVSISDSVPKIDSQRQKDALESALGDLVYVSESRGLSYDIIALYFQSALEKLRILTGEATSEDILSRLFSSFCLGK